METLSHMLSGAGETRVLLQPMLAFLFGVMHGVQDARAGHGPFFHWALGRDVPPKERVFVGLGRILVPILVASAFSVAYQLITERAASVSSALVGAAVLAAVPYALARDASARFGVRWQGKRSSS